MSSLRQEFGISEYRPVSCPKIAPTRHSPNQWKGEIYERERAYGLRTRSSNVVRVLFVFDSKALVVTSQGFFVGVVFMLTCSSLVAAYADVIQVGSLLLHGDQQSLQNQEPGTVRMGQSLQFDRSWHRSVEITRNKIVAPQSHTGVHRGTFFQHNSTEDPAGEGCEPPDTAAAREGQQFNG